MKRLVIPMLLILSILLVFTSCEKGQDGADGKDGQDGVGISTAEINEDGELILFFTDGTSKNLGKVTPDNNITSCEHEYGEWIVELDPTCAGIGVSYRICSKCNAVEHKHTEAKGHTLVIIQTLVDDCEEHTALMMCTICDSLHIVDLPPKGHTEVLDEAIPATCTESGLTEGSHCSECGKAIIPQEVIGLKPHNEVTDTGTPATCTDYGLTEGSHCSECGKVLIKQELIYPIPHNMIDGVCSMCGIDFVTYDITIWVPYGVEDLIRQQISDFMAANPRIIINASIEGVYEADAASHVIADISTAPDIYCFPQHDLARIVQVNALMPLSDLSSSFVIANNSKDSILAASANGKLYAYPMTSDNGYYLYYDTSIITEEDAKSLEAIIAKCEANGLEFHYALENAWYAASFFFATGCHSNWIMNENGKFISVDDTFNSAAGLASMKGMQKLAQSKSYVSDADNFPNVGAIVTGIWKANEAAEHFGDNLGATKLPSFTVDGETYQLGSFSGNRLMGIKPQDDQNKAYVLSLLAEYLTGEKCQLERYEAFQWVPSNKAAQASDAVQSNISLVALAAQNEYAVPQGQIHGAWWDIAKTLGADAKAATTDAELQAALDAYDASIAALFQMTEAEKKAWSVIGSICGTSWDTDFPMTKLAENVFESDVLTLTSGEQYKVRQGKSWEMNFGSDGSVDGPTCVVETSGKYIVRLTILSETSARIELVPAN